MPTNYTEIFEQAKKEKDQEEDQAVEGSKKHQVVQEDNASMQAGKTTSMDEGNKAEELVNLCVRVPKNWHREVKAYAALEEKTLAELIVLSVDQYKDSH
ncbi:hypothetical protein [Acaryochloris marina]|uniref:Uncharacterized protein n=1 Tax=Acaryochloris marina (strain MBIC 11017) TaxID=329726 RepID=A8ZLL4_ACAM1|nr:hypothetical protein [Acaryochloris marina]ABW32041.1 hypothetical protein AM1_B0322 [Acaryochloris marina MBIC11017]BDM83144.1 hypothetical protein AM10699_60050 [Acaryochloris marina MBIC10699]